MTESRKPSVLIVDDYHSIQVIYSTVLKQAGYDIASADSGVKAMELAGKHEFDVIILDIVLVDMDGIAFLRSFDCHKHPDTHVIVMSNMDDPKLREQALGLGAVSYILKETLTPKKLLAEVTDALRRAPGGATS